MQTYVEKVRAHDLYWWTTIATVNRVFELPIREAYERVTAFKHGRPEGPIGPVNEIIYHEDPLYLARNLAQAWDVDPDDAENRRHYKYIRAAVAYIYDDEALYEEHKLDLDAPPEAFIFHYTGFDSLIQAHLLEEGFLEAEERNLKDPGDMILEVIRSHKGEWLSRPKIADLLGKRNLSMLEIEWLKALKHAPNPKPLIDFKQEGPQVDDYRYRVE